MCHPWCIDRAPVLPHNLQRLYEVAGGFQRIGLSATVGTPKQVADFLGGSRSVQEIAAIEDRGMDLKVEAPQIKDGDVGLTDRLGCDIHTAASVRRAQELIDQHESILFFVNTRDTAELLGSYLHELGVSLEVHHGSLSSEERVDAEEKFKAKAVKALICTSSLELGIDIGQTDFIIQYNSPRQVTRLVQRIGRSGHHIGGTARGVILTTNAEDYAEAWVLCQRTMDGTLEPTVIRPLPLTVLANQIIALVTEYGRIDQQQVFEIMTRAYPFQQLSLDVFRQVLEQLYRQRILWLDGSTLVRKRRSRQYFLENISMIPDEKSVNVVDISSTRNIGTLDESFVLNYCEEGSSFIMKGRAWEVVRHDNHLLVSPARRTSMVPDWSGEEIPVPFEVAREVGSLRACATIAHTDLVAEQVRQQQKKGFVVPTETQWTLEMGGDTIYITTHCGSRTNETLGRIISALLAQRLGSSIGLDTDPYRIYLRVAHPLDPQLILTLLETVDSQTLESLVRVILKNSSYIRWELIKVARKFGVLSKDMDIHCISPDKLIDIFSGEPLIQEVVDRVVWEKMDITHTQQVLQDFQQGDIAVQIQGVSPMSRQAEAMRGDIFRPAGVDDAVLRSLQKRLEKTCLNLCCLNCTYAYSTTVGRAEPQCPRCRGRMITVAIGQQVTRSSSGATKTASLVASYGKDAFLVLAGYGVGPDTAARVLGTQKKGNDLLHEILNAEITYSKTRQFWD